MLKYNVKRRGVLSYIRTSLKTLKTIRSRRVLTKVLRKAGTGTIPKTGTKN